MTQPRRSEKKRFKFQVSGFNRKAELLKPETWKLKHPGILCGLCLLLLFALTLIVSCGKKTAPSPPKPVVPQPAGDTKVTQSGDSLLFSFRLPLMSTDQKTPAQFGKIIIYRYKVPRVTPAAPTQTAPTQTAPTQTAPTQAKPTQSAPAPAQTQPATQTASQTQTAPQTQSQTQTAPAANTEQPRPLQTTDFEDLAEKLIEIPADKIDSYIRDDFFVFQDKRDVKTGSDDLQNWFYYGAKLYNQKNKQNEFGRLVAMFPAIVPEAPQKFIAMVSEKKIQLTWAPVTKDIAGNPVVSQNIQYDIYRGSSANFQPITPLNQTPISGTSYEDTNFEFGKPYYYFVRAFLITQKHEQQSASSNVVFLFPQDIYPPSAPQELNVVDAREGMVLIWAPNPEQDVAGYNVYRKIEGESGYTKLNKEIIRETTFTDTNVKPGLKHYYEVSAVDSAPVPNEGPRSAEAFETRKVQ